MRVWLTEDVCAALEEFVSRPTFREYAVWPIRALKQSAQTPERELIDHVDTDLQLCGKALTKVVSLKTVRKKLRELYPPIPTVVGGCIKISEKGATWESIKKEPIDHLEIELCQLEAIADHDWRDLVNVNDYFEPQQEWTSNSDGKSVQRGEWVVSINPDLLPIGNFVVRCLLKRIEMRVSVLDLIRIKSGKACRELPSINPKHVEAVQDKWNQLHRTVTAIRQLMRSGKEMRLRDSCVTAMQVYAALHPAPDLGWLGLDQAIVEKDYAMPAGRLTQRQNAEMLDRIATALADLRRLLPDTSRPDIEAAIAEGALVICEDTHAVYWQKLCLKNELPRKQWQFLIALTRRSRRPVAACDVGTGVSRSAMATACQRLKKNLPPSLRKLIVPGEEAGTYHLELDAHLIVLTRQSV